MFYKMNKSIIMIPEESTKPNDTGVVFWSHDRRTVKLKFKLMKDNLSQTIPDGITIPIHRRLKDKFLNIQESVTGFGLIIAKGTVLA